LPLAAASVVGGLHGYRILLLLLLMNYAGVATRASCHITYAVRAVKAALASAGYYVG